MLDCQNAEGLVSRAIGGRLGSADEGLLREHVEICPACRDVWRAQQEVRDLLASYPLDPAPAGFVARFRARRAEVADWLDVANWRWWSWRLLPVAGCLVGFAVADYLGRDVATQVELGSVLRAWVSADRTGALEADRLLAEVDHDDLLVEVLTGPRQMAEDGSNER